MSNKVSNYPNAAKPQATPEEIGQLVEVMDGLRKLPPVHKNNPAEVRERLDHYFQYCADYGQKPSVEGLVLSTGVSRQTLWQWENDEKSKSGELVRRAKELINAMLVSWTMDGKLNAIFSIWLQKNHFSYSDNKVIEIKTQPEHATISDLEAQLEENGLMWSEERKEYIPVVEGKCKEC